jgi:hypothetical protein
LRVIFIATIFLCAGGVAPASQADDYTAMVQRICRQCAAALTGMPPDMMFDRCMSERHCRVSSGATGYQCELPGPLTWHGGGY